MHHVIWAPVAAFAASLLTVWWLTSERVAAFALDKPNARSLHRKPTPRTGGVGILLGTLLAFILIRPGVPLIATIATMALAAVSLSDDVVGLPAALRLAVHLSSATVVCVLMGNPDWSVAAMFITIAAVTWMTNLYNFMDGADGLAAGMTVFGFSCYGIAALLANNLDIALLSLSIAAAAAGFLVFNFHPARIFMGDVGSVPLGFLAGTLGLVGWKQGCWTWWFPAMVFSPFVVDASATLARRLVRRERVWEAHRDHYYQRLVQMGWGHRKTALVEYGLMALCGTAALAGLHWPHLWQGMLLLAAALLYATVIAFVEHAWRRYCIEHGNEA